jgi:hypothetical protein
MSEALKHLKACIRRYQVTDNELKILNKGIYDKRDERQAIELEMSEIIKLPEFVGVEKLKIDDDGSIIQIIKPGALKPWSLSKKDLREHLQNCLAHMNGHADADELFDFIVKEQTKKLISQEYNFNRVLK